MQACVKTYHLNLISNIIMTNAGKASIVAVHTVEDHLLEALCMMKVILPKLILKDQEGYTCWHSAVFPELSFFALSPHFLEVVNFC